MRKEKKRKKKNIPEVEKLQTMSKTKKNNTKMWE